jgi:hypothetical protein
VFNFKEKYFGILYPKIVEETGIFDRISSFFSGFLHLKDLVSAFLIDACFQLQQWCMDFGIL